MSIDSGVRRFVLARASRCCGDCGERVRLEIHHLRYQPEDPTGTVADGWETPDDLAALCRDCHHNRHIDPNGDFWRDPEEMADAWFGYFWEAA